MTSAKELAIEVVRVSTIETLLHAYRSETIGDVIGAHGSLEARLGKWSLETEAGAVRMLRTVLEGADERLTDEDLIAGIEQTEDAQ